MQSYGFLDTEITADSGLELLSQDEVARLADHSQDGVHELFRKCSLAVLNSADVTDDISHHEDQLKHFNIEVVQQDRGIKLRIRNAPASAFVEGVMIKGLRQLIFSVLRDIVYLKLELEANAAIDFTSSRGSTNSIFYILRNAGVMEVGADPRLVVCWGGHAISDSEYRYSKEVGYRLGLRGMNIITGCGTGAMKGPMKGALVGHTKQRIYDGRYLGISEPGIIAAESPNPIVNELVIMPDIEKRLEAFVRLGHGVVVFPGGVGTAEEILYLLGIRLHPDNQSIPFPLIFTGPEESEDYFLSIDRFIGATLGPQAQQYYEIIIDDPVAVAHKMLAGIAEVRDFRKSVHDAYHFNWRMTIEWPFQERFDPTHESMAALNLHRDQPVNELAANLRRAFSGIVAGNVKENGVRQIREHGPFLIRSEAAMMAELDLLLRNFVDQKRMKLNQATYVPCYRLAS